jgi:mono/diheme cytochrome c family protein
VDSQVSKPKILVYRFTLAVFGGLLLIFVLLFALYLTQVSDPYIQKVLVLPGDVERGQAIFQINCAGCHGKYANGSVGPSLHHVPKRKSKVNLIKQVISGKTPPMPKFQPDPQEMADLLGYLENL